MSYVVIFTNPWDVLSACDLNVNIRFSGIEFRVAFDFSLDRLSSLTNVSVSIQIFEGLI